MMNERKKWIKVLDELWLKNFKVSQFYRRATGVARDKALKAALFRLSSQRAQFAFEIGHQVEILGGSFHSYEIDGDLRRKSIPLNLSEESTERICEKSILHEKESIKDYTRTLSAVNDGPTREILIRHKAQINNFMRELQSLPTLPSPLKKDKNLKTN